MNRAPVSNVPIEIVIVGGGIAGLSAAYYARKKLVLSTAEGLSTGFSFWISAGILSPLIASIGAIEANWIL